MQQTENLKLNLIETGDPISPIPINENAQKIEAALDDSNVVRFAKYLHKLTKYTQFIVITHRRGTMNAADRLYGITMQEKGVSTLVSVNLIENDLDK